MSRSSLLLSLSTLSLVASCGAPAPGLSGPGLGVFDAVPHLDRRVCDLLGVSRQRLVTFAIGDAGGAWACTLDRARVTLSPEAASGRNADWTIAHELVHARAGEKWGSLPPVLEEGLAYWVGALASGHATAYAGPLPSAEDLRLVFVTTYDEYLGMPGEQSARLDQAAAWLASWMVPAPEEQ